MDLLEDSHDVSAVGLHSLVVSLSDLLVGLVNNFLSCHFKIRLEIGSST